MLDPKTIREKLAQDRLSRLSSAYPLTAAKSLREALPKPETLRTLAAYVDVDILRKIDDPEVIKQMFAELRAGLLKWADALEAYDRS